MVRKVLLLFLLSMHTSIKPIVGEMVFGAVGMATVKVITSPTGKAVRWATTGYLLNTPIGKSFAALGLSTLRQIMSRKFLSVQQVNPGSSMTSCIGMLQASRNALESCGKNSLCLIHALSRRMAELGGHAGVINLRDTFSKVTEFRTQINSTMPVEFTARVLHTSFDAHKDTFAKGFSYCKPQFKSFFTQQIVAQKSYTLHQATGFFPRINNYYGDQGRSNFWQGFAAGSFASWTTAWSLNNREKSRKDNLGSVNQIV